MASDFPASGARMMRRESARINHGQECRTRLEETPRTHCTLAARLQLPREPNWRSYFLQVGYFIRHDLAADVLVVPVSTVLRQAPTHVRLRAREGGHTSWS